MDNNSVNKGSLVNENVVEQPLSPVLNKKRYSRNSFPKSIKKEIVVSAENENKSTKNPEKRTSSIPIPIKENNHVAKSPKRDVQFKEIKNGFEVATGKSISTSEVKIREYSNLLFELHKTNENNEASGRVKLLKRDIKTKADSDPKIKHLKRDKKFSVYQPIMGPIGQHNFEYKLASGDISDESCDIDIKERSQFINGEDGQFNKLNMLYENVEFVATPYYSKTTCTDSVDSAEVLSLHNFPNALYQNVCKIQEVNKSQLNYNVGTDESNSTFGCDNKEIEKPIEKLEIKNIEDNYNINSQETNMLFSNMSQLLRPELDENIVGLNSSKNMVNVNITQSILNTLPGDNHINKESCKNNFENFKLGKFYGFDKGNIAQTESKFDKFRTVFMTFDSEMNDAIEAIRKKIRSSNLDEFESTVNEAARKKLKSNLNEIDVLKFEGMPKKAEKNSLNKGICDGHNLAGAINKKLIRNDPDETDSYAINAVKRKMRNSLDVTKLSHSEKNHTDKNQTKLSKLQQDEGSSSSSKNCNHNVSNPTDDTNSNSSKKSDKSQKKKERNKKNLCEGKTPLEHSDHASLKKSPGKKVKTNDNTYIEKAPENQNTISLPSNNRVQICIGNNRIKINIRSEGDKNQNVETVKSPSRTVNENAIEAIVYKSPSKSKTIKTIETIVHSPSMSKDVEKNYNNNNSLPEKTSNCYKEEPQIETIPKINEQINAIGSSKQDRLSDLNSKYQTNQGFKTASGKRIIISEEHLKNAMTIYEGTLSDVTNFNKLPLISISKIQKNSSLGAVNNKEINYKCTESITKEESKNAVELDKKVKQDFQFKLPSRICDYGISPFKQKTGNTIKMTEPALQNTTKEDKTGHSNKLQNEELFTPSCKENISETTAADNVQSSPKRTSEKLTNLSLTNESNYLSSEHKNLPLKDAISSKNSQSIPSTTHLNSNFLQRKILKPKSLLKARPESGRPSYLQGGSRKSLHFHDTAISCGDAGMNINEFGGFQTTGFSLASGKHIEIPKEKLEQAMNIFINMEKDVSGIINATNSQDCDYSLISRNKENCHNVSDKKQLNMKTNVDTPKEPSEIQDKKQELIQDCTKNIDVKEITSKDIEDCKNQIEKGIKVFGSLENNLLDSGFGFSLASGKSVDIPKERFKEAVDFFGGDLKLQDEFFDRKQTGFALASGKNINLSKDKITQAMNVFKDIDMNLEQLEKVCQNSYTENKNVLPTKDKSQNEQSLTLEKGNLEKCAFSSCKNEDGLSFTKYENLQEISDKNKNFPLKGFSCASGKTIDISQVKMEEAKCIFNNAEVNINDEKFNNQTNFDKSVPEILQEAVNAYTYAIEKCSSPKMQSINTVPDRKSQPIKKHLGMLGEHTPINVSQEGLERGLQIFKDFDFNLGSSPTKNSFLSGPQCSTPKLKTPYTKTFQAFNLTPIKTPKLISQLEPSYKDSTIIFHEKSCNNFKQLQAEIDTEYENLKKKLIMLEERKNELVQQKALIDNSIDDHRKPKTGVLLKNKNKYEERIPLKNLFNSGDESVDFFNIPQHILDITSKNAEDVHFNLASESDSVSVVKTSDGAVIVPSSANTVGVTEINNAFQAMKGVDPKLLPNGWVQNHYKWIVWKLASYERKFPQYFKDSLSIENIIQQLKYRYDIEIDRAKRPALRRIYEKDDVPQKRMVLCISDIVQLYSNTFDLELTDGWYSIKTLIDKPLCQQVYRNKIKIGTKLIIQGAELLNCENGTHPLEASDVIRLKICYNGTRRAHWYTKLGYYKYAAPFPVQMSSLNAEGGPVGFIKVYIARVYPVRFIENLNNMKIWRNGKAEEKRANEFDAERSKKIEAIKETACQEFQKEKRDMAYKINDKNITKTELSTINCPKTLYNLIQSSSDPESLIEKLTQSQQRSVMEYKQNLNAQRQHEISMKIGKQIEELKLSTRNVTSILKLVVMDACENANKFYVFNIWRPSEEHLQLLKEDTSFFVYNVTFGKTGELHSSNRTYFRQNNETVKLKKPERQLLPIAMTIDNYYKPVFDEFDTVGLIVQVTIQDHQQDLWLTDFNGRLLYITIMNGPTVCCLLDNLNRGQTVAISNLIKKTAKHDFGISIANQCSVISQYPSQKYLQKGLKMFNDQLPMNLDKLLTDCDTKIESYKKEVDFTSLSFVRNSSFMDKSKVNDSLEDSVENNSTIPSQLTMTDVAMSLIDIDQLSNNVM